MICSLRCCGGLLYKSCTARFTAPLPTRNVSKACPPSSMSSFPHHNTTRTRESPTWRQKSLSCREAVNYAPWHSRKARNSGKHVPFAPWRALRDAQDLRRYARLPVAASNPRARPSTYGKNSNRRFCSSKNNHRAF
jgi:hypothetical protein